MFTATVLPVDPNTWPGAFVTVAGLAMFCFVIWILFGD